MAIAHNSELDLAFLNIKHRIGRIALRKDRSHHAAWVISVGDFRMLLLVICG
jgi:hypothetical protein